jgi:predicted peroxiredoxin
MSALGLMKDPVLHFKTKHINTQYHYVRELISKGEVKFVYCPTDVMVADSLTKSVSKEKVEFCRRQMGLAETL